MKKIKITNVLGIFFAVAAALALSTAAMAQFDLQKVESPEGASSKITIREGQLFQVTLKSITEKTVFTAVNPTNLAGDIDTVAFDDEGNELDRATVELPANDNASFQVLHVFPNVDRGEIEWVLVSVTLRPRAASVGEALNLPIAFFSQLDPRWANQWVGASGKTIRQIGCAMTGVSMAAASKMSNETPLTMNAFLSQPSVGGYTTSGAIYWSKPPNFQPSSGFRWVGSSVNGVGTLKNAAFLKSLIDGRNYVIASSTRFPEHWVVIYKYNGTGSNLSDFEYLDPADASYVRRTVNDGKVKATSSIRVYR